MEPDSYVHRIGRTARAGASGLAVSFNSAEELPLLQSVEKLIRQSIPVDSEHPFHAETVAGRHRDSGKRHHDPVPSGRAIGVRSFKQQCRQDSASDKTSFGGGGRRRNKGPARWQKSASMSS
jgi:ATP-dependent RNA helicase RhlE